MVEEPIAIGGSVPEAGHWCFSPKTDSQTRWVYATALHAQHCFSRVLLAAKDAIVMDGYEISMLFVMKDERTVRIFLDDSGEEIRVEDPYGNLVGRIELKLIENEDQRHNFYYITWMYLDLHDSLYTQKGIGRAALCFHREVFRFWILVADNDGITRDDGSHLTGDAPGFVQQMLKEGIIRNYYSPDETEDGG